MNQEIRGTEKKHSVFLENRKNLIITGVEDILSFDDTSIVIQTVMGIFSLDGTQLKIVNLNREKNEAVISGCVVGMYYADEAGDDKKGFFNRIFK